MSSQQRTVAVCFVMGLLLLISARAAAQLPPPPPIPPLPPGVPPERPDMPRIDPRDPFAFEALLLPTDRQDDAKKKIQAAIDNLTSANGSVEVACRSLQAILDAPGDVFIYLQQKDKNGKETTVRVSARSEANRQLANLPPKALESYQQLYGNAAKSWLDEAKRRRDPLALDDVVRRYLNTKAGAEALILLASHHLDRGQPGTSAFYFDRLLERPGSDKLEPVTLLKTAVAFHQAEDKTNEELAWKLLGARLNGQAMSVGNQKYGLDQLRMEVAKLANGSVLTRDWPFFRGDARRTARGQGDAPFLEPRWHVATAAAPEVKTILANALKSNGESQAPTLPGSFPIAAAGKLICRTESGVAAFDLRTGEEKWSTELPLSLLNCFKESGKRVQVLNWIREYTREMGGNAGNPGFGPPAAGLPPGMGPGGFERNGPIVTSAPYVPSYVYENSVLGTLSTDHRRVYVIEDMPLVPTLGILQMREQGVPRPLGPFEEFLHYNKLVALDLETGVKQWEIGGRPPKGVREVKDELSDSYFLGPPLPLHGKLYVIAEKQGEIRLLCLDPANRGAATWVQPLIVLHGNKLPLDSGRRMQAIQLAYADGILVCPTLGGAVVGVDVLGQSLAWVHVYRDRPPAGPDGMIVEDVIDQPLAMSPQWKAAAPIIADGKVIIPCADKDVLVCLNLRDGKPLWKVPRATEDLFVAGIFGDKANGGQGEPRAVIVGRSNCRAVSMKDGQTDVWNQRTGMPSGHGITSGNLYYLPLQSGSIMALDVDKGVISSTIEGRSGVPGNLIAHDGDILSQTALAVAAYPQLKFKLAQIDEQIKKNPKDPVALTDRGELRLYQGNLTGAVADLRDARGQQPPTEIQARLRLRLFDAMTQMLQKSFAEGEAYLSEYRELCKVDLPAKATAEDRQWAVQEQQRRETQMLSLIAHGREKQPEKLEEALAAYRALHAKAMGRMFPNLEDAKVHSRLDVWAESRVANLFANAGTKRADLERRVREEWQKLRSATDVADRDRFVALFGGTSRAGQETRLELADLIMADLDRGRFLEAEQLLRQVRAQAEDRDLIARATDGLARLALKKGRLDEAARLYRSLGLDFADVIVRDGQTGADLQAAMASDRRLLAHFDAPGLAWQGPKTKAEHLTGPAASPSARLTFQPPGPIAEALRHQVLSLELYTGNLRLTDRQTGQDLWSQKAGLDPSLLKFFREGGIAPGIQPCFIEGRVAVVNLGTMIVGIDLLDRRVLWRKVLLDGVFDNNRFYLNVNGETDGLQLFMYDRSGQGRDQLVGRVACCGSTYVALLTRQGLLVLDLLSGQPLWGRNDVTTESEMFGDDQYLFVIDSSNNSNRTLRVTDGVVVKGVNFVGDYSRRFQRLGRLVYFNDVDGQGRSVLRLRDLLTGKDVWSQACASNLLLVRSLDPGLAGVIEPDGTVRIFDLRQRKEVLKTTADRKHFDNAQTVWMTGDRTHFHMWTHNPADPNTQAYSPSVQMRTSPVNGWFYDFDKMSGEARFNLVSNSFLILEQFEDLPVVLFATAMNKVDVNGNNQIALSVQSFDKETFKRRIVKEIANPNGQPGFHAVLVDAQAQTIDLVGPLGRVRHSQEK